MKSPESPVTKRQAFLMYAPSPNKSGFPLSPDPVSHRAPQNLTFQDPRSGRISPNTSPLPLQKAFSYPTGHCFLGNNSGLRPPYPTDVPAGRKAGTFSYCSAPSRPLPLPGTHCCALRPISPHRPWSLLSAFTDCTLLPPPPFSSGPGELYLAIFLSLNCLPSSGAPGSRRPFRFLFYYQ